MRSGPDLGEGFLEFSHLFSSFFYLLSFQECCSYSDHNFNNAPYSITFTFMIIIEVV